MAPLPPNSTGRVFVDYAGLFGERSMTFRFQDNVQVGDAIDVVQSFLAAAIAPIWYNTVQVTGYRAQAKNGLITFPVFGDLVQGTVTNAQQELDYPFFVGFVGRGSTAGRRTRLTVYGTSIIRTPDYRIDTENVPAITAVLAALRVVAQAGVFCTVAGETPVIPEYANTGYNAYYQRRARR